MFNLFNKTKKREVDGMLYAGLISVPFLMEE